MSFRPRTRIWTLAAMPAGAVSLSDLNDHLRVTSSAEDALVTSFGAAATAAVERWTQRVIVPRQAVLSLPYLPSGNCQVELPGGDVVSLTSVVADGTPITGCTVIGNSPALLLPASDWPSTTGNGYPVTITYQVGMATIPADLIAAIKLLAGEMFVRRTNADEASLVEVPISAEWLMRPHRIWPAA